MKAPVVKVPAVTRLASPRAAAWITAGYAGYVLASHVLPGPRTLQHLPSGLSWFLLGAFAVNVLIFQRVQQRHADRLGECSVPTWLALAPCVQLGLLLTCACLPVSVSTLLFESEYAPIFVGGLLAAPYALLASSGIRFCLQSIFSGRVVGATIVPVGVALVGELGYWLYAVLHPDPLRAIAHETLIQNLTVVVGVFLAVTISAGRWRSAVMAVAGGLAAYRMASIVKLRFTGTPLHDDHPWMQPGMLSAPPDWLTAAAVLGGSVAVLALVATRRRSAGGKPPAARVVAGMLVAAGVGLVYQQPQPIWTGNVTALSGVEFRRQMAMFGVTPAADDHDTIFRTLPVTPQLRSTAETSGQGLSDAQLLAQLGDMDTSLDALLAGPHADLITHEGTLKFREPTLHSVFAFQNQRLDVWILLEKKYSERKWRKYALVQDKTIEPNVAHYFQWAFDGSGELKRRGATCYRCHTSGPRAMREIGPDLIAGQRYAEQMNRYVRQLDFVETRFSEAEPKTDFGAELAVADCTQCHARDGQRGPLYPFHRLTIETLLDKHAMPPDASLSGPAAAAVHAWFQGAEK